MWLSYNIQKSSFIWYIYFRVIFSQRNIGLPDVKMVGPRLSYATDRNPSSILFDFIKTKYRLNIKYLNIKVIIV